jgi:hypothetical protein
MSPITRLTAAMCDGEDENVIRLNGVEDGVRKNMRKAYPHVIVVNSPALRGFEDAVNGLLYAVDESRFQAWLNISIMTSGLGIFFQRLGWNSYFIEQPHGARVSEPHLRGSYVPCRYAHRLVAVGLPWTKVSEDGRLPRDQGSRPTGPQVVLEPRLGDQGQLVRFARE